MKKELLISAKFDTSDFDKSVESMQKKLKEIYAPSDQIRMQQQTAQRLQQNGFQGAMSSPGQDAFNKSSQASRRELDQAISSQAREQEKLSKVMAKRLDILKELQQKQKDSIKGSQEELALKEKIARVEENNSKMREMYKQRDATLNQMLDARQNMKPQGIERLMQAYKGGGIGGAATAGGRMFSQMGLGGQLGMVGGIVGGVAGFAEKANEIYRDVSRAPVRTEAAMGSAISGTMGRDVGNIYGRRTAFEMNFAPERARAAKQALTDSANQQRADAISPWATMGKNIGGGAAAGAAGGAAYGTAAGVIAGMGVASVPGAAIGAGGGALIGGVGGAITGFGKGVYDILGDERSRSRIFNKERYQSILAEDLTKNYETSYEAQKQQNPFKTAAIGEYEQNFQRNLGAQRSMGLNNAEFYDKGGFLDKNIKAGFTPEMGIEMSNNILGAGGSSRMARDSSFGNQLQRGSNLTNAGQVLGTLSGGIGGADSTRDATIKILAEGMRLGLDDSQLAEENRRFTQAAAEVISRSGADTAGDFDRISKSFGGFQAEQTNLGVQAGTAAYEKFQEISGTQTGPRGVMRAAAMMRDKDLGKLNTVDKQALMSMKEEQLTEDNPIVQRAMDVTGLSADEVIEKMKGVNQNAVSRFAEADQIREKLKNETDPEARRKLTNQLSSFNQVEQGFSTARELTAFTQGTGPGRAPMLGPAASEDAVKAKLTAPTDRMEDNTIAAMAADAGTVLKNFNELRGGMDQAAKSAAAFTDSIREMNAELQQALENARNNKGTESLNALQNVMKKYTTGGGAATQPQGGKTSK